MNTATGIVHSANSNGEGDSGTNPVYRRRNTNWRPECIYFYLLKPGEVIERYFVDRNEPISRRQMPEQMALIMDDIRENRLRPISGPSVWRRKSYFAAVLHVENSELEEGNAVDFVWEGTGGGNHAFRSGRDVRSLRAPYQGLTGFFCINHMKHKKGHVLKRGESEKFKAHFNHPHAIVARARFGHEESGTNLGPPTPPP